jgi:transposase
MPTPQPVQRSETDRERLSVVLPRGKANVRTLKRAPVLLKLDAKWSGAEIAEACDVSQNTVGKVRKRFATGGLDAVLSDRQQQRRRAALTGVQQAHLIAIACSPAPEGHDQWTLRLLAGQAVELGFVDTIAIDTIRALVRRTSSSRGSMNTGASPA